MKKLDSIKKLQMNLIRLIPKPPASLSLMAVFDELFERQYLKCLHIWKITIQNEENGSIFLSQYMNRQDFLLMLMNLFNLAQWPSKTIMTYHRVIRDVQKIICLKNFRCPLLYLL